MNDRGTLRLRREVLAQLTEDELGAIAGGVTGGGEAATGRVWAGSWTMTCRCNTATCEFA